MKTIKLLLLVFLALGLGNCSILKNKELLNIGSFEQEHFKTELPFKLINNHMFIEVEINDKRYNFVFDTGAEVSLLPPDLIAELGLKKESSIKVTGSNKSSKRINLYVLDKIKLNNTAFLNLLCAESDFNDFQNIFQCNIPVHGFIGNNLMRNAAWKIDYKNKMITFWDNNKKVVQPENSSIIHLELRQSGNAKINITIDSIGQQFSFDTGFNGYIVSDFSFSKKIDLRKEVGKYAEGKSTTISLYNAKTKKQLVHKIPDMSIGGILLKEKIISFEENSSHLIGNKFWKNYTLTIDWKNSLLYLENYMEDKADSFTAFQYKIAYDIPSKTLSIKDYWTSHSLYKPIDPNNKIISVEGFHLNNDLDFCDFLNNDLPNLFKMKKLNITIVENGKEKEITLEKEVLIE